VLRHGAAADQGCVYEVSAKLRRTSDAVGAVSFQPSVATSMGAARVSTAREDRTELRISHGGGGTSCESS
jgi:hypothetical protein